jgi:phosphotransferase system HPr (HPr) family protein
MKSSEVKVLWADGLHARAASRVVMLAKEFRANVQLRCGEKVASARSIIGIMLLCAAMGVEADGPDEDQAVQAVTELFQAGK